MQNTENRNLPQGTIGIIMNMTSNLEPIDSRGFLYQNKNLYFPKEINIDVNNINEVKSAKITRDGIYNSWSGSYDMLNANISNTSINIAWNGGYSFGYVNYIYNNISNSFIRNDSSDDIKIISISSYQGRINNSRFWNTSDSDFYKLVYQNISNIYEGMYYLNNKQWTKFDNNYNGALDPVFGYGYFNNKEMVGTTTNKVEFNQKDNIVNNISYGFSLLNRAYELKLNENPTQLKYSIPWLPFNIDCTNAKKVTNLFRDTRYIQTPNINNTENILDASYMFYNCGNKMDFRINNFYFNNCTNFAYMFAYSLNIPSFILYNMNMSSAEDLTGMFRNTGTTLVQYNFSVTSPMNNVKSTAYLFANTFWNRFTYSGIESFVSSLKYSNIINTSHMFENTLPFRGSDIYANISLNFEFFRNSFIEDGSYMLTNSIFVYKNPSYQGGVSFEYLNLDYLTNGSHMFDNIGSNASWVFHYVNWNLSNLKDGSYMFNNHRSFIPNLANQTFENLINGSHMFDNITGVTYGRSSILINNANLVNLENGSYMFANINYPYQQSIFINGINNTYNLSNASHMFWNIINLTTIANVSNWNLSNVKDMSYMFANCPNLSNLNIVNWNLSNVKDMSYMFYYCWNIDPKNILNQISGTNINFAYGIAYSNISEVYLPNNSIENFSNIRGLLSGTPNLKNIYIDGTLNNFRPYGSDFWPNISQYININNTRADFGAQIQNIYAPNLLGENCWDEYGIFRMGEFGRTYPNLKSINFRNWNIPQNQWANYGMFNFLPNLVNLDISNWNFENFGSVKFWFNSCYNLTNLLLPENITINWLASYMFANCYKLNFENINFNNWNVNNIKRIDGMFYQCYNLTNIDVSNWNTSNVTNMEYMFYYCNNLITLNISNWNAANINNIQSLFGRCNNLSNESIDSIINFCLNCVNLTSIKSLKPIDQGPFYGTNITNDKYQNRWEELTAAGWIY